MNDNELGALLCKLLAAVLAVLVVAFVTLDWHKATLIGEARDPAAVACGLRKL